MPKIFIVALIVVTILMLLPFPVNHDGWAYKDKVEHIIIFMMLTFMGGISHKSREKKLAWWLFIYGGIIEILQGAITTTRQSSWADWASDLIGIFLGLVILIFVKNNLLSKFNDESRI
jgi:VanZ family protein